MGCPLPFCFTEMHKVLTQAEEITFLYHGSAWPWLRQEEEHEQHTQNTILLSTVEVSIEKASSSFAPQLSVSFAFQFLELLNISPTKARRCSWLDSCSTGQAQREAIPHNPGPHVRRHHQMHQEGRQEHSGTLSLGTSRSCFSASTWTRAMPPLSHSQQAGSGPNSVFRQLESQGSHPHRSFLGCQQAPRN